MLKIFNLLAFIFFILPGTRSQRIDSALASFTNVIRFEKAYVHFDNSRYTAGQTIWYKAYLLSGSQPSISKSVYIDWYDDNGRVITSTVTPVLSGFSSGSFLIPVSYSGSFIHAVAYTKWMRNFDRAYFYEQTFRVLPAASAVEKKDSVPKDVRAQFLPESGAFLSDKLNVFAFKAIDNYGRPEAISGMIRNSKGESVLSFRSVHDGMGKFQFKAIRGESYSVIWTDMSGKVHQSRLPAPETSAVNLLLEPGRSNRIFHIQRTATVPERMKQLTLAGQMNGRLLFETAINLWDRESATGTLPVGQIASGILQLTVFDADAQPVCERMVFIKNDDYLLKASLRVDTLNTQKRGRNVVEIELDDSIYANLSVAVTDAASGDFPVDNIVAQLLLKGDLRGAVYRPGYYFASDADSALNHLDLVMLTNGWRRYNWSEILQYRIPELKYAKDSAWQSIHGKVKAYKAKPNTKPDSIQVIFVAKDSSNLALSFPILADGSFEGKNVVLFDTMKVWCKMNGVTDIPQKDIYIGNDLLKGDTIYIQPDFTGNAPLAFGEGLDTTGLSSFQALAARQISAAIKYRSLQEVTVRAKQISKLKELDSKYTQGIFAGDATAAFDMGSPENASHRSSIFDFLTGKVQGLEVGNTNGGTATEGVVEYRRAAPTFYLDERAIPASELVNINLENVAYIKVFSTPFAGGLTAAGGGVAGGGAIVIYTRKGIDTAPGRNRFLSKDPEYTLLSGYAPGRTFYTPDYAETTLSGDPEDLRSTLLWDPWITMDKKNKKVRIVFYNNDVADSFRVTLEGMDSAGKLIHISRMLK